MHVEEIAVNIVLGLASSLEFSIVLGELGMVYIVNTTSLFDCILCQLANIDLEGRNGDITILSGKSRDGFVHERSHHDHDLGLMIHLHLAVHLIGKQSYLGLVCETVVHMAPHLLVSLCCFCVCIDALTDVSHAVLNVLASIWLCLAIRLMFLPSSFVNVMIVCTPCPIPSCLPCLLDLFPK